MPPPVTQGFITGRAVPAITGVLLPDEEPQSDAGELYEEQEQEDFTDHVINHTACRKKQVLFIFMEIIL